MLDAIEGFRIIGRRQAADHTLVHAAGQVADNVQHRRLRGQAGNKAMLLITEHIVRDHIVKQLRTNTRSASFATVDRIGIGR